MYVLIPCYLSYIFSNLFILPNQYKLMQKVFYCNCDYDTWSEFCLLQSSKFNQYFSKTNSKISLFLLYKHCKILKLQQTISSIHRKINSKYIPLTEFPWKQLRIKALIFSCSNFILPRWIHLQVCKYITEDTAKQFWNDKIDFLGLFFSLP